ncbi:DNA-3-methyladenine glycosylase [Fictibacillus macauensis ZFHKF-1]|uniref:DNA-3-methyladenine glycosylase n=1 Tax=Fictibacillus macauensis ZFHKF-1 TaxID=1196324 RepID=I8J6G5_9BACL|nr:DNA-3-methyladenine glycosylase I [Fictibacillus macauensis]EIT87411.1 DNA-3-methyladenine glycosylase [Fictibacillus macauensis ZFHKF-1]
MDHLQRCKWSEASTLLQSYHDQEWGELVTEDDALFECLTLEMFQAGLSWSTILHKREHFRQAFDAFNVQKVRDYSEQHVEVLVNNARIVRHRKKIEATIENARRCANLIEQYGSLYQYMLQLPTDVEEKKKALKQTFKHVGLTTAESFLMATGFISPHHEPQCWKKNYEKR